MKRIRIETHCHSRYSFDCNTTIESIISSCKKMGINALINTDHDVCGISDRDAGLFEKAGIVELKGIEFTSRNDVHIIGVSQKIKLLERERFWYSERELVDSLTEIGAYIIIPHPYHGTGLIGNGKVSQADIEYILGKADFIEQENYRYGRTKNVGNLLSNHPNLKLLVGSDAHSSTSVGAMINEFDYDEECGDLMRQMKKSEIFHVINKRHGSFHWIVRDLKKSHAYQLVLNLFPADMRRKIKNKLVNR